MARAGALTPETRAVLSWTRRGEPWGSIEVLGYRDRVALAYRCQVGGGEWQTRECPIDLAHTPCGWGGSRSWFVCPRCGRRVAILYLGRAGTFACRHCCQLAYACQRETDDGRATRRADKIRERLGWEPGILNGAGWKPTGMHWSTYERLKAQHDAFVGVSLAWMAARLRRLDLLGDLRNEG